MKPRNERDRRRDQTARLPGRWRRLGARSRPYRRQPCPDADDLTTRALPQSYLTPGLARPYVRDMNATLTETEVENLWQNASGLPFLAELCEQWLDAHDSPTTRARHAATIRSYVKGSRVAATVGL